jgi:glycine cleavage system aminomethyltransferase T
MTLDDTPLHVTGMERLVEPQTQDYMGKTALEGLAAAGVDRKLVGAVFEGVGELRAELSRVWPVYDDDREVGRVTDAIWSPGLRQNIGYMWVPIDHAEPGSRLVVVTEDGDELTATVVPLPFVDPQKRAPSQDLRGT